MPAPPLRNDIAGTGGSAPSNATARTGFGALWDYVTTLLGATGDAVDARTALGVGLVNFNTAYTTGGTSTAYTLTPTPAITAYEAGQSFFVNFNAASGASPTLAINGVGTPPNLVKQNPDGTFANIAANEIPSGHRSRVTLIGTTQALVEKLPNAGPTVQVFTASGTYTKPTDVRRIRVRLVGGGAGGGSSSGANTGAGGGGGGGYSEKVIDASAITTVSVTIGAGGASNNNGGTTSFGSYCSATGGTAGDVGQAAAGAANGGAAGVGSNGDINTTGIAGFSNPNPTCGGAGGASLLGGGGRSVNNQGIGTAAVGYGGGGGGGGDNSGVRAGGAGAAGVCIVEEFY